MSLLNYQWGNQLMPLKGEMSLMIPPRFLLVARPEVARAGLKASQSVPCEKDAYV